MTAFAWKRAFRYVDATHSRVRLADGSYFQKLRDYCGFEVAAYQISLMLAMDNIPACGTPPARSR